MAAMQSINKAPSPSEQEELLGFARLSIQHGLTNGKPYPVNVDSLVELLSKPGAAFVTIHKNQQLRGCIGNLQARQPLAVDVSENAFAAAFRDPRFPAVIATELDDLHIEISVLTPHEPIDYNSEAELVQSLEPFVDGLVLEDGCYRGTFLPSVWQQLPQRESFFRHLKAKAGMPADYWHRGIKVYRYRTNSFGE